MVRPSNTVWSRRAAQQNVGQDICSVMWPLGLRKACRETVLTESDQLVQIQGTNIRHYYKYVLARARAYRDTRIDWVREGGGRLKRQTVDKGLLRETVSVQDQISSLLTCDVCAVYRVNCPTELTKTYSSSALRQKTK